ncbi:methyltransferase family protein [Haloferax elongans ATCC BAA-1513]|uniref:Methyltransferase family protein n=1 Tax=Haloferax elongans ATCC BAA-1513 TaxID=1230453 RepID=M0HJC4_HALEO|nr:methyltransferase [Haloferax elongans]ELZ83194.1 methyltransferase family protein [Haloferax elongans ATCC BAA-1513]
MPVNPNFLERLLLLRLDKGPAPILDLFGASTFEAVVLALDIGLFDELASAGAPLSATELADRLDADANAIEVLLTFLDAQGYVTKNGGRYRNTRMTTKWLLTASETNMAPWLTFWDELVFPFWEDNFETVVREGHPPQTIYEWFDEEPTRWETAQKGFRAAASVVGGEVADAVDIPDGATRLLDVGGGHGLYAIELCRRHPNLSAVVFDYPEALDVAREEITAAGLEDRVEVAGGDYWEDDLGAEHDVVLVFNVIHAHDDAENRRLFERVGDSLRPGGQLVVLDQLAGTARMPVGKTGHGFVGLTYLVTLDATIHPYEAVRKWLREAGFDDVRRTAIRRAGPGQTVVQATKR